MLSADCPQKLLAEQVTRLLAEDRVIDAAKLVRDFSSLKTRVETKEQAFTLLGILLHWLLNNEGLEEAALMLWGTTQFDPRPDSTQRVWRAFEDHNNILLMGAGSMSKSFSMAIKLFLEWIRDPEYTTVKVLGPSEQHLEDNLFTHLVQLHKNSRIPLPGTVGKLFIGLNLRERKSSISGVVIPLGKKAAGRLQGVKRSNRKTPHPLFGKQSRLFIFLDEIANIPGGIWRDIDNLLSNTNGNGLKIIGAFNPTDQNDPVGQRCEPPDGWASFDPDAHFQWTSSRGWYVVRLDAAKSENVLTGRVVYEGLQTREGFNLIIQNSGGMNSPGYWSMARGCFPPTGTVMSIIAPGMVERWKADVVWFDTPRAVGGVDMALEGGDRAEFAKGLFGQASAVKYPATLAHPDGETIFFKDPKGRVRPRYLLLVEQIFQLPVGDTIAMAQEVERVAKLARIEPEWLAVDRTGNGQGVYDLMRHNWGQVIGVNYSEGASETKVMAEDTGTGVELFDRMQSELWFATKKFIEFRHCFASPGLDLTDVKPQLTSRLFRAQGKKCKVESKPEYKSRNQNKSPDKADAVTLIVHAVRKGGGFIPSMTEDSSVVDIDDMDDDRNSARCDETNRFDYL